MVFHAPTPIVVLVQLGMSFRAELKPMSSLPKLCDLGHAKYFLCFKFFKCKMERMITNP